MADATLQSARASANPLGVIDQLATDIQELNSRVRHLLGAIDTAARELEYPDVTDAVRIEMTDRITVFASLAMPICTEAQDKAEEIEKLAYEIKWDERVAAERRQAP